MNAVGGKMVKHIREMAFMGFWNVFINMFKILRNFQECRKAIKSFKPDLLILIDYPGFNLRMAKYVRKRIKIPVYYYISPTVWAWKAYRVKQIKRNVTHMLTIIPFETEFYAKYGYKVHYVGNPTVDSIHQYLDITEGKAHFKKKFFLSSKPIIALLPGSRKQEIATCLPKMVAAAKQFPEYQIVISGAPGIEFAYYFDVLNGEFLPVVEFQTYQLLYNADLAIVNSGTATLEAALIGTPQMVIYHLMGGRIAYLAKEVFIKLKYISLVNILAEKEVVKEFIAHLFSVDNLVKEMHQILENETYRKKMLTGYKDLQLKLGEPGAAKRAALFIINQQKLSK